jgi:uncharacterized protein YbbK (DUF523 family)
MFDFRIGRPLHSNTIKTLNLPLSALKFGHNRKPNCVFAFIYVYDDTREKIRTFGCKAHALTAARPGVL